ncbi:nucleotidyl transferase AbiEii/AbiGii toxin family protein [Aerolutibacter ruishenii]|uniref:nucleotidyl transferase AbiEii/AbiGii toxin family protein n=1 Tax=Aerolutibacter ruishenii TaxID=686800 RepID=UPI0013157547|nr:nucleotidyl transferase AbiEii/AbiGii toxin family protein [Lysobacter ruishenii]
MKSISEDAYLGRLLTLKGATCFRKIYLPESRYSDDLDFSSASVIDERAFAEALNRCCSTIEGVTAVHFNVERTSVGLHRTVVGRDEVVKEVYRARLFFSDFYGNDEELSIAVQMDVSTLDTPVLASKSLPIIHPYSDRGLCAASIQCLAVEELLAAKLKCLLQRRHVLDLFDMAYAHLWRNELGVDRSKIVSAFLRKTIFERSPGAAREILLAVPTDGLEEDWRDRLVCPADSRFDLRSASERLAGFVSEIFAGTETRDVETEAFFPAALRFPILRAGSERRLIRLNYDGTSRLVEPYALLFKKPENAPSREYFYAWNLQGGSSPPGWRSFLGHKVLGLELTDVEFEPRVEIQLYKAAEASRVSNFRRESGRNSAIRSAITKQPRPVRRLSSKPWPSFKASEFVLQCPYCQKKFKRTSRDSTLRPHKAPGGYVCGGRRGTFIT